MRYIGSIVTQTCRNFRQTWGSQLMTMLTVGLSVLIFSFFFLVYLNIEKASQSFSSDLMLTVYFNDDLNEPLRREFENKINAFEKVEKIVYLSRADGLKRLAAQLGEEADILETLGPDFLPVALEIHPGKSMAALSRMNDFSEYLATLPGAIKVQYGRDWLERMSLLTSLIQLITLLSGGLLVLSTTFVVSYTVRLTVISRREELEILRLLGASNSYIKAPLILEGLATGLLGTVTGLACLFFLHNWVSLRFGTAIPLTSSSFTFFPAPFIAAIVGVSILLCTGGSLISIRKFLQI